LEFFGRTRLQPVIDSGGVVNAASFQAGAGLAAGSYITIRGRAQSEALRVASSASLPLSLAGVSVSFDAPAMRRSLPGRLHFVSETQINVQIPWEFQGLTSVDMKVSIGPGINDSSAVVAVPLADYAPALFEYDDAASGRRLIAARDLANNVVSVANPARRGRPLILFANGVGPVTNRPPTGEPTPVDPLPQTRDLPVVTIGNRAAEVSFSGLAPFNTALYQINVTVATDTPAGLQPIVITVNGVSSKTAMVQVE
ncbi:MAG: hypothetical protein ACRD96_23325, partial [Bryobacteraceae bacterium]